MANESDVMLTTYNNPYDPFTNWDEWYTFDIKNGTDCCGYLSRIASEILSNDSKLNNTNEAFIDDESMDEIIDQAMDKIVKIDSLTYLLVRPNDRRYKLPIEEFKKTIPIYTINDGDSDE